MDQSEKKYFLLYDNFPISIILLNQQGDVVDANPATEKLYRFKKDELIGEKFTNLLSHQPEILHEIKARFNDLSNGRNFVPIDVKVFNKEKDVLFLNIQASLLKVGEKMFIQIISQEINYVYNVRQQIKESEEKFRTITEQSLMGITIIQDNLIKYANQEMTNIFGYTIEEMKKSLPGGCFNVIHPDDVDFVSEHVEKRQKGLLDVFTWYQYRIIHKSGKIKWVQNHSKLIQYRGKPADLIFLIDITKQKEAEGLIKEENKKLKELDEIRKNFCDVAAHELKTPLTSIYGANQLLFELYKEKFSHDHNFSELVEMINKGSEKLKIVIENLFDISKLELNKISIVKQSKDLVKIILDSISALRYLINNRKQNISLKLPKKFYLQIDHEKIERVITNLLSNAIKFTPPKGKIQITLSRKENFVLLAIKDTGIGLTKQDMKKLFKKFSKIDNQPRDGILMKGTGLGLFIAKELIKMHGGQIWAESAGKNKGTTFHVKLPIK